MLREAERPGLEKLGVNCNSDLILHVLQSSEITLQPGRSGGWRHWKVNRFVSPSVLEFSLFYVIQLGANPGSLSATIILRENVAFVLFRC